MSTNVGPGGLRVGSGSGISWVSSTSASGAPSTIHLLPPPGSGTILPTSMLFVPGTVLALVQYPQSP